jgi:phosphodiesterase/alkaline phosphatase D-like protein
MSIFRSSYATVGAIFHWLVGLLTYRSDVTEVSNPVPSPPTVGKLTALRSPRHLWRSVALAPLLIMCSVAFSATPALAAAPEAPELTVESHFASPPSPAKQGVLHGELNPHAAGEVGSVYEFLYKNVANGAGCEGESALPGVSAGAEKEVLPAESLSGLAPDTEYTVCLVAYNGAGTEKTSSTEVMFTTAPSAEPPIAREATEVMGDSAVLHGELNPQVSASAAYEFMYNEGGSCEGGSTTPVGSEKTGKGIAVSTEITGLTPKTEYTFCAVAVNNAGEPVSGSAIGSSSTFHTLAVAPPKIPSESASAVTSTGATLEAQINPDYQITTYSFEYSAKGKTGAEEKLEAPITTVNGAAAIPAGLGNKTESVLTGTVLVPGTTYYYRAVATNGTPPATDGTVQSFTTVPAPTAEAPTLITAETATLNGKLMPLNGKMATKYYFEYNIGSQCSGGTKTTEEAVAAGSGTGTKVVSAAVTGLQPNAKYMVCLVASNNSGSETSAPVPFKTFVVAPKVDSESASGVTSTAAKLEGRVNPNNQDTHSFFQYSTSATVNVEGSLATSTDIPAAPGVDLGAGGVDRPLGPVALTSLAPGTTYYYQAVATSVTGTIYGTVQGFTTVPTPTAETPTLITATTATFNGKLTSLNKEVPTEYWFDYALGTKCSGAGETAHISTGKALGEKAVSAEVTGLQPNATYAVCLVVSNSFGSETSAPISFGTLAAPPTVEGENAPVVTPFEVQLEAQVNPNNEKTSYSFEYSTEESGGKLSGTIVTIAGTSELSATYGNQTASVTTAGHPLRSDTTYHFRVIAENAAGKSPEGAGEFTTLVAEKPVIESESVSGVTPTGAKLRAQIDPNYQETSYIFEYAAHESEVLAGKGKTVSGKLPPGSIATGFADYLASAAVGGLEPDETYYYRVIATNATGTTEPNTGVIRSFKTLSEPIVSDVETQSVTSSTAVLSGAVNPEGLETTYHFVYVPASEYEPGATNPYARGRITPQSSSVGSDYTAHATGPVSISELRPNTTYDYALVATNSEPTPEPIHNEILIKHTTTVGPTESFTTGSAPIEPPSTTEQIPTTAPPLPASPFKGGITPAFIPYTSIAALDATEAHENKGTGTSKKAKKSKNKKKHTKHKKHNQKKKK